MRIGRAEAVFIAALGLWSFHPHSAKAADIAPAPETSDWTFTAAAYLWGAGLDGKSGVFGLPPQDIDISFGDVLENLDFAFMGLGEARNGPFSVGLDLVYSNLSKKFDTPNGIVANSVDASASTFFATGYAGYAVFDTDTAHFDLIAGARIWSVQNNFDVNGGLLGGRSFDDGATWVDPLVGAKFMAELSPEFYVSGWGMIGGFGISSEIMWDVMGGAGYNFTDSFSLFAGYRATGVDYSNDGFVYDTVQHGPVFAGVFRF